MLSLATQTNLGLHISTGNPIRCRVMSRSRTYTTTPIDILNDRTLFGLAAGVIPSGCVIFSRKALS